MLCHLKYGLFIFFAFWVVAISWSINKYLLEAKEVPIEEMTTVWQEHKNWGKSFVEKQHCSPAFLDL
ncbi:hypothetical protein SLEP1_g18336 [Rubroshorea leprosula]|uniref:Uncharacterized protein n=1 Tax=Rubroshorea leprosula TaxID=152421 RepID=A0AAV5IX59_9ROSI|nr:hypothetical protein SLEP1_g18336 [Rubroshorea leprosula]